MKLFLIVFISFVFFANFVYSADYLLTCDKDASPPSKRYPNIVFKYLENNEVERIDVVPALKGYKEIDSNHLIVHYTDSTGEEVVLYIDRFFGQIIKTTGKYVSGYVNYYCILSYKNTVLPYSN